MKQLFISLCIFIFLTGCGQSGKLYLPEKPNVTSNIEKDGLYEERENNSIH